jgi:hypothetical protein
MNRRQEERVADLGRAFHEAVADIVNLGESAQDEMPALEVCERIEAYEREEVCRSSPSPAYPRLAQHEIKITQAHNGFIVSAGCQIFVFEKFEKASKYIAMYFQDPEGTEQKHREGTLLNQYL